MHGSIDQPATELETPTSGRIQAVTPRYHRRLRRAAVIALAQPLAAAFLWLAGIKAAAAFVAVFVLALPLLLAWGPYQAQIALNPVLRERGRRHWRIAMWCLPGAMSLYWHRHLRHLGDPD